MNLLNDKREQELSVNDNSMQNALFESLNNESQEPTSFPQPKQTRAKKSLLGPILAAILVFVAAFVIVYYGFYKKSFRIPSFSKPESTEQSSDSTASVNEDDNTDDPESVASTDHVVSSVAAKSCIQIAPEIMNSVAAVLGPNKIINALFFDEGSFSAEISASSTAEAATIYRTMESSLGEEITLTSSAPQVGQYALIAGTFASSPTSGKSTISSVDLEEKLRELAEDSAAMVASVNISTTAQGQSVFLKLDGSFDACRQFLQRLARQNLSLTVSKLLLMPGQNDKYAFVLRFYL